MLQHALRRIWLAADEGREEMDLIHYAMVGGMRDELPATDQARFARWQATLPARQQAFLLAEPSLHNVLDAHARRLHRLGGLSRQRCAAGGRGFGLLGAGQQPLVQPGAQLAGGQVAVHLAVANEAHGPGFFTHH